MNSKIVLAIIGIALIIIVIWLLGSTPIIPVMPEEVKKVCVFDDYPSFVYGCSQNDLGAKFLRKPDTSRVADAPDTYYDSQGNVIKYCGGFLLNRPQSELDQ